MGSLYSENSKSSQNWSLSFPEIPSNSKLFKSELICIVGNFWEFLGIPRKLGIQFARVICIIGNFWEFLGIPRNSQKTGNSVPEGEFTSYGLWLVLGILPVFSFDWVYIHRFILIILPVLIGHCDELLV